MRVAVIGGGIAGLFAAWELAQRGADVTVVERDRLGEAASLGHGGWIVKSLTAPVSTPGSVRQGMRLMLKRDNPFHIRPRLSPQLALWLYRFWRSSARDRFAANVRAIYALVQRTYELFDELAAAGVAFEAHTGGLIFVCVSESELAASAASVRQFVELGYPGDIEELDADALRAREPSVSAAVVGGLHLKDERHVRPESLTAGLAAALDARGARIIEHSPVSRVRRSGDEWHLDADGDAIAADRVVLAAGVWTNALLRPLGQRLMLEAGNGYSLTSAGEGTRPQHPLYLVEPMVGASPYRDAVRLGGMLDISGMDESLKPRRTAAMVRAASQFFDTWRPTEIELEWTGLRPLSPDGLPYLGPVKGEPGLFVCTGGGMAGFTIAPAAAAALAPAVLEDKRPPELEAFSPDRF